MKPGKKMPAAIFMVIAAFILVAIFAMEDDIGDAINELWERAYCIASYYG